MEKLLWLFKQVHGDVTGSCYLEVDEDATSVQVMKDGNLCWEATTAELLLDYLYAKEQR